MVLQPFIILSDRPFDRHLLKNSYNFVTFERLRYFVLV